MTMLPRTAGVRPGALPSALALSLALIVPQPGRACEHPPQLETDPLAAATAASLQGFNPCVGGFAGPFPCSNVDLMTHLPLAEIGGGSGNDIWGWTDPETGREYALVGRSSGTSFVDVTDPANPVYLGDLPTHSSDSFWRDIKVHADHALIVSEASGHGMQVFHLEELRNVTTPPVTFTESGHYAGFGSAHNIVVDNDTGFAYAVGTNTCSGGLHMIDVSDPDNPVGAGCFSTDGYTHDAQCVTYAGPDADYTGRELCFNSNEDTLTIVDVTDKANPVQVSRTPYDGSGYTHQGWLTEDHARFLLDDELDETGFGHNTRTRVWDLADLDAPSVAFSYYGSLPASDHNLYVHQGHAYQANYRSGLRILDLAGIAAGGLSQVAYFDIYPANDNPGFAGAWSLYPYFASGTVVVSGIGEGLFVLRPTLCTPPASPTGLAATPAGDQRIDLSWDAPAPGETVSVYRSPAGCPAGMESELVAAGLTGSSYSDTPISGQVTYHYRLATGDATGLCSSELGECVETSTTGACTAPPLFAGITSAANAGSESCAVELTWPAAGALCGGGVTYSVYRAAASSFVPSPLNRIAQGLAGGPYLDGTVPAGGASSYIVRAVDAGNGAEDPNQVTATVTPAGPVADGTFAAGAEIGDPPVIFGTESARAGLRHVGWEFSTARLHSGDRSYFSTHGNGICITVATAPIALTAGEAPQLSFWSVYDIEDEYDGGVVEISADGGVSWSILPLVGGYPGSFRASGDACGFAEDDPSFTGTDLTWGEHTADLSAWAGGEVILRWIYSTDNSVGGEGWYVDDVAVTHAQLPGPCTSGALFADGFESGDLGAWSLAVP